MFAKLYIRMHCMQEDVSAAVELLLLSLCILTTACSRKCQNGGKLNSVSCMCSCAGGFTGTNCESECTVCGEDHGPSLGNSYS